MDVGSDNRQLITATESAPWRITAEAFSELMPPIATRGLLPIAVLTSLNAAKPTGEVSDFVSVGKIGPKAK